MAEGVEHGVRSRTDAATPLASVQVGTPLSIVIPTFREVENAPLILRRLAALRATYDLELEVLFLDDDSRDGIVDAVAAEGYDWARVIVRSGDRGLSAAVIDGFRAARHPVIVCMDCDLSHPPEVVPQMMLGLEAGQQMVIGSRYVPGGSTDDDWGLFRYINSLVATLLARPLTAARDPMSGFFALRKVDFDNAEELNPVGYKIGLELIVKCGFVNVGEVPIHFADRVHGESKLTLKEQLKYIQHLRRLYIHRFGTAMDFLQFLVVGASGTVVNLTILSLLKAGGASDTVALAGGIGVSLVTNFLLNRRFTFSYARDRNPWKQFLGFITASAVGMGVNFAVALTANETVLAGVPFGLQISAVLGIASGMVFNFIGNRYVVFRKRYISNDDRPEA
ncbi:MAG: glycosyltransferase family 2 protein [Pseudomonadota bacterium]